MLDSYTVLTAAVTVPLPWASPPLSQNDRQHHHVKAKKMKAAIAEARATIAAARLPHYLGADIVLVFRPATRRRRDSDNLAPVTKAVVDALVQEGVLPDDSWVHVPHSGQTIVEPVQGEPARMWVQLLPPGSVVPALVTGDRSAGSPGRAV